MITQTTQPCPFACGGQTTHLSQRGLYYVCVCNVCGAEGPYTDTAAEAVAAWDKRANPHELELIEAAKKACVMFYSLALGFQEKKIFPGVANLLFAERDNLHAAIEAAEKGE